MDELRRRLEFSSRTVKIQAVKKLYDAIVTKHKASFPINESTPESVEMSLLWEMCANSDAVVCQESCEYAVVLVLQHQADFGFVLSKLITLASIAGNYSGIVNAIGDLLKLQLVVQSADADVGREGDNGAVTYTCPFTISVPVSSHSTFGMPHPLITLLTGQPDCWPVLIQLIEGLFATVSHSFLLVMLEPFVKFVMLDPNQPAGRLPLQLSLWSVFLRNICKSKKDIVQYLLDLVPAIQVSSRNSSGQAILLLNSLGHQLLVDDVAEECCLRCYVNHSLVFASGLIQKGTDASELLRTLLNVVKARRSELDPNLTLLHCVSLLSHSATRSLQFCLEIVHQMISACPPGFRGLNLMIVASLVLPILQLLALPELFTCSKTVMTASVVLNIIEDCVKLNTRMVDDGSTGMVVSYPSLDVYDVNAIVTLIYGFRQHSSLVQTWLKNLALATEKEGFRPPFLVSCLVAAILVISTASDVVTQSLDVLCRLSAKDVTLSVHMLPLLLYRLSRTTEPKLRLAILYSIPRCATHKVAVGPVMATLQTLSSHPKLHAMSLRLASSLWQQQERCFMYLLQMLEGSFTSSGCHSVRGEMDEVLLARASCIRDICQKSASKHGEEMIAHLSAILNDCTSAEQAPAACLALQGLALLCEAEVIDVRTAWNVLATKLRNDQRPLVLVDVTRLLSLAPGLAVDSKEYQAFLTECLGFIWCLTNHSDARVAGSAFRALLRFPTDLHSIDHFPEKIRQLWLLETAKAAAKSDDKDDNEEDSVPVVPGICYARLLQSLPADVLPDFGVFLSSLVCHEASNFPRGLTFSASQQQVSQSRALASIPSFLLDQFESNQKPGSRSNLAVGLLFCYDAPLPSGRDGKRRLQSLVSRGKEYHQMLYTLINDVSVEPSNWYQCVVKIPAWAAFMERCFLAYAECRSAELQLELERGLSKDPADNQLYQKGAWLWARDKLTDLIKSCSRGTPVVQSNCVSALAGLALTVSSFTSQLDPEVLKACEALTEHLRQPHWFVMVTESLLTIIDTDYQSKGRIFTICTQKTSNQEKAAQSTILARSAACTSVSMIVSLLQSTNIELVYATLRLLVEGLPGKAPDMVSDVLQMHYGIGLGLVISKLLGEHFVDVAGSQGKEALWSAIHALEESAFSAASARCGSLAGLVVSFDALCMDVRLDSRHYIEQIHNRTFDSLSSFSSSDRRCEALPLCLAVLSGASFIANIGSVDVVNKDCERLISMHDLEPNNVELCRAVGTQFYMLQSANHPNVNDLIRKCSSAWKNILDSEDTQETDKVAALTGLTSLVGCHRVLAMIPSEESGIISEIGLEKDVIRLLKFTQSASLTQLRSTGAWLTGLLYLARVDAGRRQTAVPTNYHFLPQTSVLRPLLDLLTEYGKRAPSDDEIPVVAAILHSMTSDGKRPFPPLNWAALLGPVLRLPFGPAVEEMCVRLAIQQSTFLPNLSSFVSSCMLSPFYNGLKTPAKACIYRHLHILIRVIPVTVLNEFFSNCFLEPLRTIGGKPQEKPIASNAFGQNDDVCVLTSAMLEGLEAALKEKDPPQNISVLLWKTLETVCSLCPFDNAWLRHLCCGCLPYAPESLLDGITSKELQREGTYLKRLFMRCYLVATGNQPLVWLNHAIETVAYNAEIRNYSLSFWFLLQTFSACSHSGDFSESCQPLNRMQWLLELMGHIKNLLLGFVPLANQELSLARVVEFFTTVFMCAVVSWSGSSADVMVGLSDCHVLNESEFRQTVISSGEDLDDFASGGNLDSIESILRNLAPGALLKLMSAEPWKQITGRMIEWFLTVHDVSVVKEVFGMQKLIKDCLLALRHENDFKKASVWSRVVMLK